MLRRLVLPAGARVLDAGCGTGRNLAEYRALGWAVGVDVSRAALSRPASEHGGAVAAASVEALPFRAGAFDLVCATDVVEHLDDDVAALDGMRRVAAPGGYLLLTVPAYQALWSDSDVQLHHRRRYTAPGLSGAVAAAGGRVERTTYFNSVLLPAIAVARRVRRARPGRSARTELERTPGAADTLLRIPMLAEARAIGAGVRIPGGVSIALLARNPAIPTERTVRPAPL
jgi:SAM-dependent methyltransferase